MTARQVTPETNDISFPGLGLFLFCCNKKELIAQPLQKKTISPLYLSFLVRLTVYIVNLCVFYSYRLIGKLTDFFGDSGVQYP